MVLGAITPTLMDAAMKVWTTCDTFQTEEIQQTFVSAVSFAVLTNSAYHLARSNLKQVGLNLAASAALRMSVDAFKHQILDEKIIAVTTHIISLEDLQKKQEKQIEEKENQIKRQEKTLLARQWERLETQQTLLSSPQFRVNLPEIRYE